MAGFGFFLASLAALSGTASAASEASAPPTPIEAMIRCRLPGGDVLWLLEAKYVAGGDMAHKEHVAEVLRSIQPCLDAALPEALKYAAGAPDLRASIKEFYVKESAATADLAPIPNEGERAYQTRTEGPDHEVDEARTRMRMEAKLADK